ncbi:hypothetical protein GWI33_015154 [Rhynchophorus ferrugineus]|uniref:Uncharacterized protein n=1 Tax=Rhynchophorus ferrugineus TaxID=354439 RepID=A0A834M691_RHYFE|nr:hypothetical protein GWI33_015154 [Rhynchophorus ferrugineus]
MAGEPHGSPQGSNITSTTPTSIISSTTTDPREYYKTYDVMTGVRIAATLGSFFGLMVLLVLYKSKSKTEKALEDPTFTAAAVAEAEEEERQIQLALEATAYQQLNPRRASRKSLDISNGSHSHRGSARFSSVGGYSSLLEPPVRTSPRLPCFVDEDSPQEDNASLYEDVYYNSQLDVPRRPSNITCSSSGSSYLERRDSAVTLGFPALPAHKYKSSRRQSSPVPEIYDFYYPIDIRVTQPTPGGSPCGSDRAIYDRVVEPPNLKPRLAPLASISSCNSSLGTEYPDCEGLSYACDTYPDEEDENTENGVDPFDTDSDVNSEEGACYDKRTTVCVLSNETSPTISADSRRQLTTEETPLTVKLEMGKPSKSSSTIFEATRLPQISLTDVHRLSMSSGTLEKKCSWTQETLF